jgi:hypothetical protein
MLGAGDYRAGGQCESDSETAADPKVLRRYPFGRQTERRPDSRNKETRPCDLNSRPERSRSSSPPSS